LAREPEDLESLIALVLGLDDIARDAAIARFCERHPSEDPVAVRWAVTSAWHGLTVGTPPGGGPDPGQHLELLRVLSPPPGRYAIQGEVARGGMGAILRVRDQTLGRPLAMKVILGQVAAAGTGHTPPVEASVLARFLDEAQITGQLDHPGVVPVHELGIDQQGGLYFTMRLVKGRTADEVFALAREQKEGWTKTRALEVILKVCDALAYAHAKKVVHRDIKPSNVMVGRFGEVYVMDWGLAKVLGSADRHDLRIKPLSEVSVSRVRTARSVEAESDPDSPVLTMDGAVVGTPCYMSPEQAEGRIEQLGVRSDVYAVGAMLYELLAGTRPYLKPGQKASPYAVLRWVSDGPPAPLRAAAPDVPAELEAICEKAMARQPEQRYADAQELGEDLRAYLERRVVRAYRTGAFAEMRAWVRRNRGMAAGVIAAMLALATGGTGAIVYARRATLARQEAERQQQRAETEKGHAETARRSAEQALADFVAEQKRKAEVERKLRLERIRRASKEQELNRLDLVRRSVAQAAQTREQAKGQARQALARDVVAMRLVDTQLRTLAALDLPVRFDAPASRETAVRDASLDRLAHEVVGGAPWVRGRWLLLGGEAAGAVALLRQRLADLGAPIGADAPKLSLASSPLDALQLAALHAELARSCSQLGLRPEAVFHDVTTMRLLLPHAEADSLWQDAARRCAALLARAATFPLERPALAPLLAWLGKAKLLDAPRTTAEPVPHADDVALRRLRAALWLAQGRLGDAAVELDWLAGKNLPWYETEARTLRLRGLLADAVAQAQRVRSDEGDLEEARSWLAANQPHWALDLLTGQRPPVAAATSDPLGDRHLDAAPDPYLDIDRQEARAHCQASLGRRGEALASLAAALPLVPVADVRTRARIARQRGELLLQLGQPEQALAAFADQAVTDIAARLGDLPDGMLAGVATAAERAGRSDLADAACAAAAARTTKAPAVERAGVLLQRAQILQQRGSRAEATRILGSLAPLLPDVDDAWLRAQIAAYMAADLAVRGHGRQALAHLDRAASACTQWLREDSRFVAGHAAPPLVDAPALLATIARRGLHAATPSLTSDDAAAAWRVVEAFRAVAERRTLTRPLHLAGPGIEPADARGYEAQRARLIDLEVRLQRCERDDAAERRRLADRARQVRMALQNSEARLRARAPAYCGAIWPRVVELDDVRAVLPNEAALVVFASDAEHTVAFVTTRNMGAVLALPGTAEFRTDLGALATPTVVVEEMQLVLDRLGGAFLQPIVAALAPVAGLRTLLLAPDGELGAIPFEACRIRAAGGDPEPLIARYDVACVPSGTAYFDQVRQQRHVGQARQATPHRGGLGLAGGSPAGRSAELGWIGAALRGWLGAEDRALLESLGPAPPADAVLQGKALRLLAGARATDADLAQSPRLYGAYAALALSLPLHAEPEALLHPWLQCARSGDLTHAPRWPYEVPRDGRITPVDLRDLGVPVDLALVRNAAPPAPTSPLFSGTQVAAEAQAMASLARALWSGGAAAVVTVSSTTPLEAGQRLLDALASARDSSVDPAAAWSSAWREELRRGQAPMGIRLWCVTNK